MNIEQLTDIAYEVASELEPQYSFDVFDVTDSQIIFHDERGLFRVPVNGENMQLTKQSIKKHILSR